MKAFIAIVFIAAFIDVGSAVKCYMCAGTGSSDCADPFSASSSVTQADCSSTPLLYEDMCYKLKGPDGSITRSCSVSGVCSALGNVCQTEADATVCCCNGNLCNSASTTGISYATFASLIIASFLGMM